jgi:cyanophycin synthetase
MLAPLLQSNGREPTHPMRRTDVKGNKRASAKRTDGIKILRSGVSVYEVEVDLGKYATVETSEIKGFSKKLLTILPSLRDHECFAGECGGFVEEMTQGTDLAHVMEHVILEFLRLANGSRRKYSGWTRKTGRRRTHVIHFQAPGSAIAMRASQCAIRVIESIMEGRPVSRSAILKELRDGKGGT